MSRSLPFLAAALFLWGLGEGMFINFIPIYLDSQFALDAQQIGMALGVSGFFMTVAHIPSGHLADRIGRRPMLIAAWLIGFLSTLIMASATRLPVYLIGFFAYGLTIFVSSPLSSYVAAGRGEWSVATALALNSASFNIGMAVGPLLGGWTGEELGMRASYTIATVIFSFSTALIFFIEPQPIVKHDEAAPPVSLWNNAQFLSFLAVIGLAVFAMYLAQPLTPSFIKNIRHVSLGETGLIFSAGALGNVILTLGMSRFAPRRGFFFAQVAVILFALCIWLGTGLPVLALGYFLMGGYRAARPIAQAQTRELVHDSQMGLAFGMLETVTGIIAIVVPPLAGFVYERDPFFVYPLAIGLICISILVNLIYTRKVTHA